MAPLLAAEAPPPEPLALLGAVVVQVMIGLALGFVAQVLFSVFQAAGDFVDLSTGFAIVTLYDPFSNTSSSLFGRFYQLVAVTILFASHGHLLLVRGFYASFRAVPLGGPRLGALDRLLTHDVAALFTSALQIAAPILGALFVTEVALGLLARAAPQANVFLLGLPFKILLGFLLVGIAVAFFPGTLDTVLKKILESGAAVTRIFTG